jgi:hypothetical protein
VPNAASISVAPAKISTKKSAIMIYPPFLKGIISLSCRK